MVIQTPISCSVNTSGAVLYANAAKISFYIKGRKETFFFKNKTTQIPEQSRHEPRKRTNRRNRNKQVWTESAKMVTAVHGGQGHRLKSLFLTKKDDPDMPSIYCSINGYNCYKTLCVAEPPKCLGPPTPVVVLRTSDGDAGDPPTLEVR